MTKPLINILDLWSTTIEELSQVVNENPSLRGMMLGYLAERKLRICFEKNPEITALRKDDDHNRKKKGDLVVTYKGHEFKIESKALQTSSIRDLGNGEFKGAAQCDASDRRKVLLADGDSVETTCLLVGEFDILAVCLFGITGKWDFAFIRNEDLPRSTFKKYSPNVQKQLIKSLVPITWPIKNPFVADPFLLMNQILKEKQH